MKTINQRTIPDIKRFSILTNESLSSLYEIFIINNFTSEHLLKIFGKEVTRHININNMEVNYLRNQVLYSNIKLRVIVDLFLLRSDVCKFNIAPSLVFTPKSQIHYT